MMSKILHTKFGNARIRNGYFVISSRKEGNNNKALHRLIFEDFYRTEIPKGFIIHHKDGNKLNNCILNLQLMRESEHHSLHSKGENNAMYGFCGELSPMFGKNHSNETKTQYCKDRGNSTGFFRVSKCNSNSCNQGFTWVYRYYEGESRKTLSSISFQKLKKMVLSKGLDWFVIDEEKAKKTRKWSN